MRQRLAKCLDFDDALYPRLRVEAARRGRTIRDLVADGVRHVLGLPQPSQAGGDAVAWFGSLRDYGANAGGAHDLGAIRERARGAARVTVGIDTSVAVRLLVGEPAEQAEAARRLLEASRAADDPAALSDLVAGEVYFALRHHYRVPHGRAVAALRALLADPSVRPTAVAREALDGLSDEEARPGLMDRLIHGDYRRDGVELHTFDRDAARLAGARLIQA